jgi:hypothetical protein
MLLTSERTRDLLLEQGKNPSKSHPILDGASYLGESWGREKEIVW